MSEQNALFLSPDEIRALTGAAQPAAQQRILAEMGLRAHRNRANVVMLSREALVRWQLGDKQATAKREPTLRMRG